MASRLPDHDDRAQFLAGVNLILAGIALDGIALDGIALDGIAGA